jgi:adenine phosphoribosyltransferase
MSPATDAAATITALVRDIPDWPQPGVVFKDITPLLNDGPGFATVIDALVDAGSVPGRRIDRVIGVEARGFVFAAPVAYRLGAGFVPVRKPGKLPHDIEAEEYVLEYGVDLLEIHRDAVAPGEHVLIVDDVLATGGTAAATARLVEKLGGVVAGFSFVMELAFLHGRDALPDHDVHSLVTFGGTEPDAEGEADAVAPAASGAGE